MKSATRVGSGFRHPDSGFRRRTAGLGAALLAGLLLAFAPRAEAVENIANSSGRRRPAAPLMMERLRESAIQARPFFGWTHWADCEANATPSNPTLHEGCVRWRRCGTSALGVWECTP